MFRKHVNKDHKIVEGKDVFARRLERNKKGVVVIIIGLSVSLAVTQKCNFNKKKVSVENRFRNRSAELNSKAKFN